MLRAQTHGGLFLHKHRHKHPWQKTPPGGRLTGIHLLVRHSNAIRVLRLDLASQPLPNTFFSSAPWNSSATGLHRHLAKCGSSNEGHGWTPATQLFHLQKHSSTSTHMHEICMRTFTQLLQSRHVIFLRLSIKTGVYSTMPHKTIAYTLRANGLP